MCAGLRHGEAQHGGGAPGVADAGGLSGGSPSPDLELTLHRHLSSAGLHRGDGGATRWRWRWCGRCRFFCSAAAGTCRAPRSDIQHTLLRNVAIPCRAAPRGQKRNALAVALARPMLGVLRGGGYLPKDKQTAAMGLAVHTREEEGPLAVALCREIAAAGGLAVSCYAVLNDAPRVTQHLRTPPPAPWCCAARLPAVSCGQLLCSFE